MNMLTQKKIKKLQKGSHIALLSPSWGGPSVFPQAYDLGKKTLEQDFGFIIKEYPTTHLLYSSSLEHVKARANDINNAFADSDVDGIICTIGGSDALRLLPFLDESVISDNPKFFMGYSDSVNFLVYLYHLGVPSFHGPSVMSGLAEQEGLNTTVREQFTDLLMNDWDTYKYPIFLEWSEDSLGWSQEDYLGWRKKYKKNKGMRVVRDSGPKIGTLLGGCIEILSNMRGTGYELVSEDLDASVLFIETSEDKPSPYDVQFMLRSMGVSGNLEKVNAVLIGKSRGYSDEEYKLLEAKIEEVFVEEFGNKDVTIISNIDCGHTSPIHIYPIGTKTKVDPKTKTITLLESPFK
jgi:muramoyltetrapeptide carboxypeptidase LdcA involved in peptidoglycan recycling